MNKTLTVYFQINTLDYSVNEMMSVIKMGAFFIRAEGFNEMRGLGQQWPGKLLR